MTLLCTVLPCHYHTPPCHYHALPCKYAIIMHYHVIIMHHHASIMHHHGTLMHCYMYVRTGFRVVCSCDGICHCCLIFQPTSNLLQSKPTTSCRWFSWQPVTRSS